MLGVHVSINTYFMCDRVLQDRREQAKQDLKGLEETVVSYLYDYLTCPAKVITSSQWQNVGYVS